MNKDKRLNFIKLQNKFGTYSILKKNQKITLYLCGPTVYDDVHIGNLRGVFLFDLLARLLKEHQFDFVYYQNITNIDDKIVARAQIQKKKEADLSNFYLKAYYDVLTKSKVLWPQFIVMTDFISNICHFIERLLNIKAAYIRPSGVYFDTQKIKYSHPSADKFFLNNESKSFLAEKKHPYDFALWKNNVAGQKWKSPWGLGRPGWHTECVALIDHFAGKSLNIHGGGNDLIFPHHFNEEIQFNTLYPESKFSDFWLRNGFVSWQNYKLSKSVGLSNSLFLAKNFLNKYSANVLRFVFFFVNYEQDINFQESLLLEAQGFEKKIKKIFIKVRFQLFLLKGEKTLDFLKDFTVSFWEKFILKLNNNLDTVQAMDCLNQLLKKINLSLRNKNYVQSFLLTKTLMKCLFLLGITINLLPIEEKSIDEISAWQEAIKAKKYLLADQIRVRLQQKEILI